MEIDVMTEKFYNINSCEIKQHSFLFVVATARNNESELNDMPIYKTVFSKMKIPNGYCVDAVIFFGNSDGLGRTYNKILLNSTYNKYDFIIFVHDDVWINDVLIFDKLISASKDYDLIGVCGGKGWKPNSDLSKPMIWTNSSAEAGASGYIIHTAEPSIIKDSKSTFFNNRVLFSTNYGECPDPVLTIDGNFICFTKKAINASLMFDDRFKFHFYDMDVSFSAFMKKLRTGTSGVIVTHDSIGLSVSQSGFMEGQLLFLKKWFGIEMVSTDS